MKRADKIAAVEQMNAAFLETPHVILASFNGLGVNQANELRSKVRAAGGTYRVVKNRLAKLAAQGTPVEQLVEHFAGPVAVAAHGTDPVALAKTLQEFAKDNPQIELKAGIVDAKDVVDAEGVKALSMLPGLPELRAQLLALIQTPATTLVRLLGTPGTQLARVIDAYRDKQDGGGE